MSETHYSLIVDRAALRNAKIPSISRLASLAWIGIGLLAAVIVILETRTTDNNAPVPQYTTPYVYLMTNGYFK